MKRMLLLLLAMTFLAAVAAAGIFNSENPILWLALRYSPCFLP